MQKHLAQVFEGQFRLDEAYRVVNHIADDTTIPPPGALVVVVGSGQDVYGTTPAPKHLQVMLSER